MAKNKHITEPDVFGYQVRIVRRGKETSRYFSHKLWGNKGKSLNAAITWRDQMLVVLKGSKTRFLKPPKNKTTTGVTGVSRTIKYDHRKDKNYLCYTVFWVCNGKSRNKTFQVGNVDKVTADDMPSVLQNYLEAAMNSLSITIYNFMMINSLAGKKHAFMITNT